MRPPRILPPFWFLLALLAMWLLHRHLPGPRLLGWPWTLSGLVPVIAGVGLVLGGAGRFRRAGTPIRPFTESTALVLAGPFRWTRNPMYLGLLLALAGVAVCLGTTSPWLPVPAVWWVLDRGFVRNEEALLGQRFGSAYDDYCRRVRRWLGRRRGPG